MMLDNWRRKLEFPLSLVSATLDRTALWTLVRRARARIGTRPSGAIDARHDVPTIRVGIGVLKESYKRLLLALADELAVRRVPFVLIGFPTHQSIFDCAAASNHLPWLSSIANEARIPFVNLLPSLAGVAGPVEDLVHPPE